MRSEIKKARGVQGKGHPSIASLSLFYAVGFLKTPELLPLTRRPRFFHPLDEIQYRRAFK